LRGRIAGASANRPRVDACVALDTVIIRNNRQLLAACIRLFENKQRVLQKPTPSMLANSIYRDPERQ
jgi:hypothetical protein